PWILLGIGIFGSLLLLADAFYYRFFGDVLSAPALLAARQTGHVWGSVSSLFTPGLSWLIADWPFAVWLASRASRQPQPAHSGALVIMAVTSMSLALLVSGAIVSAPRVLMSAPLDQMF